MGSRRNQGTDRDRIDLPRDEDVIVLGDTESHDRAAEYREWVARMRAKRAANQQRIRAASAAPRVQGPSSYWTAEQVFRESQRVAEAEAGNPRDALAIQELLAVLGLSGAPEPDEIEAAFRRLAKAHHPDRHVHADEATRNHHLEQMRRVNEAYAHLRRLQLV